jgi:hypothetical protein
MKMKIFKKTFFFYCVQNNINLKIIQDLKISSHIQINIKVEEDKDLINYLLFS